MKFYSHIYTTRLILALLLSCSRFGVCQLVEPQPTRPNPSSTNLFTHYDIPFVGRISMPARFQGAGMKTYQNFFLTHSQPSHTEHIFIDVQALAPEYPQPSASEAWAKTYIQLRKRDGFFSAFDDQIEFVLLETRIMKIDLGRTTLFVPMFVYTDEKKTVICEALIPQTSHNDFHLWLVTQKIASEGFSLEDPYSISSLTQQLIRSYESPSIQEDLAYMKQIFRNAWITIRGDALLDTEYYFDCFLKWPLTNEELYIHSLSPIE